MNLNKMTDACFDMFDTDRSGFMDTDELHKALNALYDKVNSTLNCNMKHPTVEEVHAMLAESEVGQDRPTISKQGFRDMVTGNFSSRKFTDTIAFKVRHVDFCISVSRGRIACFRVQSNLCSSRRFMDNGLSISSDRISPKFLI